MNARDEAFEPLSARLESIEGQNRFLTRLVIVALFAILGLTALLLVVSRTGVVEAREFVLRDPHGERRAVWTTTSEGISVLRLLDQHGEARATLSVTSEGEPTFALTHEAARATIAVTGDGPALGLFENNRRPLIAAP